jgi:hypothetical protein
MKAVVAVTPAALAPASYSPDLLCVLFQIIELRNARLEGADTAFVRVQIDKVAQVGSFFFSKRALFEREAGALSKLIWVAQSRGCWCCCRHSYELIYLPF